MYALAGHADEREAHLREVDRFSQTLPEGSYGGHNRQATARGKSRQLAALTAAPAGELTRRLPVPTSRMQAP
jgi:hypothetical protein